MDQDLRAIGIDLDPEFEEIFRQIPISTAHQKRWRKHTRQLFQICQEMGLEPVPMPKMGDYERCKSCGRCIFGCPEGVKWDSRQFLDAAVAQGAQLITGCRVESVEIEDGRATGVWARHGLGHRFYPADLVILAAGGFATPAILEESGIPCEPHLFVDPVLTVATRWPGSQQCREVEMPFVVQRPGYILSPYFDFLSFFFNDEWKYPARDILGIMIKLAESNEGSVTRQGVQKTLTAYRQGTAGRGAEGGDRDTLPVGSQRGGPVPRHHQCRPSGWQPAADRAGGRIAASRAAAAQPLRRRRQLCCRAPWATHPS